MIVCTLVGMVVYFLQEDIVDLLFGQLILLAHLEGLRQQVAN